MSSDPKEFQALERMERMEDRICRVENALQTLMQGESWVVRHAGWVIVVVAIAGIAALAWVTFR